MGSCSVLPCQCCKERCGLSLSVGVMDGYLSFAEETETRNDYLRSGVGIFHATLYNMENSRCTDSCGHM